MKLIGSLLNTLGFLFLLVCIVLLGADTIANTNATSVVFLGWEIGISDFNGFFAPVFQSTNAAVQFVVNNLIPCAIGGLVVMLLGAIIRKAATKKAA